MEHAVLWTLAKMIAEFETDLIKVQLLFSQESDRENTEPENKRQPNQNSEYRTLSELHVSWFVDV